MPTDAATLNISAALKRMSGDAELLKMLIMTFLEDAPKKIERMQDNISIGCHNKACIEAHALKGAASTIGAERLADIASYLECELKNLSSNSAHPCALPSLAQVQDSITTDKDLLSFIHSYVEIVRQELQKIAARANSF